MGTIKSKILIFTTFSVFIAVNLFTFLVFTNGASAASQPKLPLEWVNNEHDAAVDNAGNIYYGRGYICQGKPLSSDGRTIPESSQPNEEPKQGGSNGETASFIREVYMCPNDFAASYVWTTEPDNGIQLALVVAPSDAGQYVDTKIDKINGGERVAIFQLSNGNFGKLLVSNIQTITVDESLLKQVDKKLLATASGTGSKPPQADATPINCEVDVPVLGWLICNIAELVDDFVGWVDKELNNLLSILPSEYGEVEGEVNSLKTAWSAMRIIATVLLVGVALFMIISQMLNMDVVSAYTIKKVVPRLVIATILIQLSWFLFVTLIIITNTVASGLQTLIYAPFGGSEVVGDIQSILGKYYNTAAEGNGASDTAAGNAILLSVLAVGGVAAIGGGIGLLGAAIGVLIAVLIGFVVLVLRKVVLITLLVISPLALVAWILPNTQKLWSTWWQLFSKLLLMFPMIVGLLAVGKVFAYIVASIPTDNNGSAQVRFFVILIAYFGPYLLIPATFSVAGGVFAKATGALSNVGNRGGSGLKKLSDDQLKGRAASMYGTNKAKNAFARAATGNITRGRGARSRTAALGLEYANKKKAQEDTLIATQISGLSYGEQGQKLIELANGKDSALSQAALRRMASTARWGDIDKVNRDTLAAYTRKDADFSRSVAQNRRDLIDPNYAAMSEEALVSQHGSFWDTEKGNAGGPISDQKLTSIYKNDKLWSGLDDKGKQYIEGRVGDRSRIPNFKNPSSDTVQDRVEKYASQNNAGKGERTQNVTRENLRNMPGSHVRSWFDSQGGVYEVSTQDLIATRNAAAGRIDPSNPASFDQDLYNLHSDITSELQRRGVVPTNDNPPNIP